MFDIIPLKTKTRSKMSLEELDWKKREKAHKRATDLKYAAFVKYGFSLVFQPQPDATIDWPEGISDDGDLHEALNSGTDTSDPFKKLRGPLKPIGWRGLFLD